MDFRPKQLGTDDLINPIACEKGSPPFNESCTVMVFSDAKQMRVGLVIELKQE